MKRSTSNLLQRKLLLGIICFVIIIGVLSLNCIILFFHSPNIDNGRENDNETFMDSIVISNDIELSKYSSKGNGSQNNPYIIENYIIKNKENTAILIFNVTKYFVIKNCTLVENNVGITLKDIKNGTAIVENNSFKLNSIDIKIETSSNITIIKNEIIESKKTSIIVHNSETVDIINNVISKSSDTGVFITLSENLTIYSNFFSKIMNYGINVEFSEKVDIEENVISDNNFGLYQVSSKTRIKNNTVSINSVGLYIDSYSSETAIMYNLISNNEQGILVRNSAPINISFNTFINNVFEIYESYSKKYNDYILDSNIVNNKTILILVSQRDLDISSLNVGYLYLINCNNISIRNSLLNQTYGINVINSKNIKIQNIIFEKIFQPIVIKYSEKISLKNNTFIESQKSPISISNSNTLTISRNNIIEGKKHGVYIFNSYNVTLENNTIKKNKETGIKIKSDGGSYFYRSNIAIFENNIGLNKIGIRVENYHNISIFNNTFYRNSEYGVKLEADSVDNIVYNNVFFENHINNKQNCQGYNENPNNLWFQPNSKQGNFWDLDISTPYLIGGAKNYDLYPISESDLTDTDNDSVLDWWEKYHSLDFTKNDSLYDFDHDNLTNYDEFFYKTDPYSNDTDSDSLTDSEEVFIFQTNPNNKDSDGDEMNDAWEIIYGLNPLKNDSEQDKDKDGLSNLLEFELNTYPNQTDSDNDGMDDYFEYIYNLDPLFNDSNLDYDGDGLENILEYYYNTDPTSADTDGDGYTDKEEVEENTDPNDPFSNISIRTKEHQLSIIWWIIRSIVIILIIILLFFITKKKKKEQIKSL